MCGRWSQWGSIPQPRLNAEVRAELVPLLSPLPAPRCIQRSMLCAPRLTLLWPICRNSIPSQPRDPRSLQRDNSSPWNKGLGEDGQIARGGGEGVTSSPRWLLFISPPDEPVDCGRRRRRRRGSQQPGEPPPSSPLPLYFTVYCLPWHAVDPRNRCSSFSGSFNKLIIIHINPAPTTAPPPLLLLLLTHYTLRLFLLISFTRRHF